MAAALGIVVLSPACKQAHFQGMVQKPSPTHTPTEKPHHRSQASGAFCCVGSKLFQVPSSTFPRHESKALIMLAAGKSGHSHTQKQEVNHLLHWPWRGTAVSTSPALTT